VNSKSILRTKILTALITGSFLLSCTMPNIGEPTVTRKLISAKAYKHATKENTKEDIQECRKTVLKDQVDKCMSQKGWTVIVKRYD